jgi:hypothetical protein
VALALTDQKLASLKKDGWQAVATLNAPAGIYHVRTVVREGMKGSLAASPPQLSFGPLNRTGFRFRRPVRAAIGSHRGEAAGAGPRGGEVRGPLVARLLTAVSALRLFAPCSYSREAW